MERDFQYVRANTKYIFFFELHRQKLLIQASINTVEFSKKVKNEIRA